MSEQKSLYLTIDYQNIAWLSVNVAGKQMNVLSADTIEEMEKFLTEAETKLNHITGVVICSGKPDSFIAGADVKMLDSCRSAKEAEQLARRGQQLFDRLSGLHCPVVCAVHGLCLGGGLEMALACDYRICSDDDKTRLGLPEVKLGLLPGSGGTQRLPRQVGLLASLDIMLTGKQLRAKQAKKLGLVDECVPQSILSEVARRYAKKGKCKPKVSAKEKLISRNTLGRKLVIDLAIKKTEKKTRGNYPAAPAILDVVNYGLKHGMEKGLLYEAQEFGKLMMTPESEALRSIFFATTELKKDNGSDAVPEKISKAAVLGGGLMGAGISYACIAKAKVPVRIKDVSDDGVLNALQYSYRLFDKLYKRRILSKSQLQAKMNLLSGGTDFTGFHDRDIVIEAVFEDLTLKQNMVADIEQHAGSETIFATNTSTLPIYKIAENAQRPENIIGLHYFSPADKMPLVEVIPHKNTSDKTIATVMEFARKQGKTPILVKDSAGFYVNRILVPYMNEAATILLEGEPIDVIDTALLNFGFPVGPIALLDEVGVDIGAKAAQVLLSELGERFRGPDLFNKLLNDDRRGRKSGKGFYSYKGKKKKADTAVYKLLKLTPEKKLTEEIAMRCLLPMLNEAVRCLDEGIIKSARDGDIGAIFGIGFPPFLGGPFRFIEHYGAEKLVEKMNQLSEKYGDRFAPCDALLTYAGERKTGEGKTFYTS